MEAGVGVGVKDRRGPHARVELKENGVAPRGFKLEPSQRADLERYHWANRSDVKDLGFVAF